MPNAELVLHPPRGRPATFSCESGAVASQLHIPEAIEQSVLAGVRAV